MGTTVSSLQILGVSEEDVRAALPKALVGRWSERFVTACPNMAFQHLDRKAGTLSKKLDCTILSVSMFDGDTLSLAVYQGGKRLTGHIALPENCKAGDPKLFCSALGLPEELAPKLKRLFTDCAMQEDKLGILQALLGAPLFIRFGDNDCLPTEPLRADAEPLETWLREHPLPPKIKNQCKAELLQEIPDRGLDCNYGTNALIFRVAYHADDVDAEDFGCKAGDIIGCTRRGGEWAHPLPDGQLELTPLEDTSIKSDFGNISFACLGDRLVMTISLYGPDPSGFPGAQTPVQTVVVRDTAGILPCPLPLALESGPAAATRLHLLPDGGFLAEISPRFDGSRPPVMVRESVLACYGPDGARRWTLPGIFGVYQVVGDRIYAAACDADRSPSRLLALDPGGNLTAKCPIPFSPYGAEVHILDGTPYILEPPGYQKDALLRRLTPDLRPDGKVLVPYMSTLALSPDSSLLYAAGFESGLRTIDAAGMRIVHDLPRKDRFTSPVVDGQNRLWVANGGCFECYTPELELISRHRLKGSVSSTYCSADGHACAVTFQQSKYIIRVYRFS